MSVATGQASPGRRVPVHIRIVGAGGCIRREGVASRRADTGGGALGLGVATSHGVVLEDQEVVEAEPPEGVVDALELLAGGATCAIVEEALGAEAPQALAWCRELGLLTSAPDT